MDKKFDFDTLANAHAQRIDSEIPAGFFDRQRDEILQAADRRRRRDLNRAIITAASVVVVIGISIGAIVNMGQSNRLSTDEMIDQLVAESTDAQLSAASDIAEVEMMFDSEYYN